MEVKTVYTKKVLKAAQKMVEIANGDYWNEAVANYDQELRTSGKFSLDQMQQIHNIAQCTINGRN